MDRDIILTIPKKIIRMIITAKIVSACVTMGKAVYRCKPKYDRITNIDTDLLIEQNTENISDIDLSQPENLPGAVKKQP